MNSENNGNERVAEPRGRRLTIGLIDDHPHELDRTRRALERTGCKILATSQQAEVDRVLDAADGGLALDARLERFSERSVDIARRYSRIQPGRPIWFVSDFFQNGVYDKLAFMITPLTTVSRFDKAEVVEAEDVRRLISEQLEQWAESGDEREAEPVEVEVGPISTYLQMEPAEWARLAVDVQDDIAAKVETVLRPRSQEAFGSPDVDWIVLGGPDGEILRWGRVGEYPSDALLDEIQASEGVVPFFVARELEVDSISLHGIPWPGTSGNSHYPSLHVRFETGTAEGKEFLFDTGADANYLDRTLADSEHLRLGRRPRTGYRLGQAVRFREVEAKITLYDGRGTSSGTTSFRAVRNWEASIGREKQLPGLFSNKVLVDLQTAVRICGRRKTVSLDESEDD